MDLDRRLNALREQRKACDRLVAKLPRDTPEVLVRATKTVCNDIEAEIRTLLQRVAQAARSS